MPRARTALPFALATLAALAAGCGPDAAVDDASAPGDDDAERPRVTGERRADGLSPRRDSLFDALRSAARDSMAAHDVPGLALVVVDRDRVLWTAGLGVRDRTTGGAVTPGTVFSLQSISKLFTALATMRAVEDGLLELDATVAELWPNFTVNSRFSERPTARMTVRDLLTHAAGFTHEAPVGNNYDAASPSMEAHVESIGDTWLKFPVGSDHAYSNLGYDLAAYLLQRRSGRPFPDYMASEILEPLGMEAAFVDTAGQILCGRCAVGHRAGFASLPDFVPMTGSGGVRASAEDAGRFLRFLLRFGVGPGGERLLETSSLVEVFTPTGRDRDDWPAEWNGRGTAADRTDGGYVLHTHGGGFGYRASLVWRPGPGIGAAVLTNSDDHGGVDADLADRIADAMAARGLAAPAADPDVPSADDVFAGRPDTAARAAPDAALDEPTPWRSAFGEHLGTYRVVFGGGFELAPTFHTDRLEAEVLRKDGYVQLRHPNSMQPERLIRHEPGLFFGASSGEALDLRDEPPTLRNIELRRVEGPPAPAAGDGEGS